MEDDALEDLFWIGMVIHCIGCESTLRYPTMVSRFGGRQMSENWDEPSTTDPVRLGIKIGIAVVLFWFATPFLVKWQYSEIAARGQFGDLFGSINALFSGLAFVGVIVAILMQKQELALQRRELSYTRQEMKRTADAQEAAQQALNKTIWAQSYKVAMDVLTQPNVLGARQFTMSQRARVASPRSSWDSITKESVEIVGRNFDNVGTMIRKGLLPEDYIVETMGTEIGRQWHLLSKFAVDMRRENDDPLMWKDFERLAAAADAHLREHNIPA
ncbi:hypothetical protein [Bradyrhizobium sp. AUGA SZCCT0042]|uniref:DUF4760 domain-containing protein n=1 Tax=Bradyrhizobium sp. AUGA SZCCT0042 TaxID=2807651 RepID=UPI001BA6C428|nr:hypothetical protein [Bradyrhizobium sp. AUGA SZCCT0042]MBR1302168.1 hypothetical protein [Bradyrhizobium sp. AUGA SZCCT0042]